MVRAKRARRSEQGDSEESMTRDEEEEESRTEDRDQDEEKGEKEDEEEEEEEEKEEEEQEEEEEEEEEEEGQIEAGHPYGVEPLGNLYFRGVANCRDPGLGLLNVLTDELLLEILELCSDHDLRTLAQCSKALYVFTHHEEPWKSWVLRDYANGFKFEQSWRQTFLCARYGKHIVPPHTPLRVKSFFSDVLFQPWFCASMQMPAAWTERDTVERRSNLSLEEFIEEYEKPSKPVIITDVVTNWEAYKSWNKDFLCAVGGDVRFVAQSVTLTLPEYFSYAENAKEENPLYIFDKRFAERCPALGAGYTVPEYFREDLFSVLGEKRPDYRWLIIGPKGSGSVWHIDPNNTSAWNALVRGHKKWMFYPPDFPPPGVFPSADGGAVTQPVSLSEWYFNYYRKTKKGFRPLECIVSEGEVIFVPSRWWHSVLNLDDTIAITQNYVSKCNLISVLNFLKEKREYVAGYGAAGSGLYEQFLASLEKTNPDVLNTAEQIHQRQEEIQRRYLRQLEESQQDDENHLHQRRQPQQQSSLPSSSSSAECKKAVEVAVESWAPQKTLEAHEFSFGFD